MMSAIVPHRCEPPVEFCDMPYHWVQWRTPYRSEAPQPWGWNPVAKLWRTATTDEHGGSIHSPERAAVLQWHYLKPAYPPIADNTLETQLARILTAQYFSNRYDKPIDDPLVQAAVEERWEIIGLPKVPAVMDLLHKLQIRW